jgi:D-alanyl-lipoteichoic acid acyltransferase DltB (MBOAT superfamily)
VTRLKALKLGVWGALITAFYFSWVAFTHDRLGVPTLLEALALDAAGTPLPVWLDWVVVLNNYLVRVLEMCASFHVIVAIIRMAGFRIPRNTARPLSSRTLADFWNRYNYYFKEFLVDFFFFPAFLRFFKKHPKLRLAFATFCAATVGNLIYHVSRDVGLAVERGVAGTFLTFDTYAFYCLILTAGLIISQMRGRKPAPEEGFFRYQVLPRVNVGIFFCLLGVFDDVKGYQTLGEHLVFFGHLFGVSL